MWFLYVQHTLHKKWQQALRADSIGVKDADSGTLRSWDELPGECGQRVVDALHAHYPSKSKELIRTSLYKWVAYALD